jgi:hypothetical protein
VWPIQLAFPPWLYVFNTSSFLTRSVQLIFSILLQSHISKIPKYFWSTCRSGQVFMIIRRYAPNVISKIVKCVDCGIILKCVVRYIYLSLRSSSYLRLYTFPVQNRALKPAFIFFSARINRRLFNFYFCTLHKQH